jgi:hypothetical protein
MVEYTLFGYKSPQLNCEMLNFDISPLFLEMCNDISHMPGYNTSLVEASGVNLSMLNLTYKLNSIIDKYIGAFRTANIEIDSYISSKYRYLSSLIEKNHTNLTNIPQDVLMKIRYERIEYNTPIGVPGILNTNIFVLANSIFTRGKINDTVLKKLKDDLKNNMYDITSGILKTKNKIELRDVDSYYTTLFKRVTSNIDTPISNSAISALIDRINSYPINIRSLDTTIGNIIKLFTSYKNIIGEMFMYTYVQNDNDISVYIGDRVTQRITLHEFGYHNSYRTAVLNHLITILDLYLSLYGTMVNLIKEKISYEENLLLKIIQNIK